MPFSLTVVIDTREQAPFAFTSSVAVVRAPLAAGDYSILGYEHLVAVERKSHADAWGSVYNAASRRRIERVATALDERCRLGGLGVVAICCSRAQLVWTPPAGLPRHAGPRVVRHWLDMTAPKSRVPILWDATAEAVEELLLEWAKARYELES